MSMSMDGFERYSSLVWNVRRRLSRTQVLSTREIHTQNCKLNINIQISHD